MTILYEGFGGHDLNIVLGIIFSIVALVALGCLIVSLRERESEGAFASIAFMALAIVIVLNSFIPNRYPIVRATIDDTTSFKEVYESYELIDVEGDIYTFKVKDSNE